MAKLVTGVYKSRANAMLAVEDLQRHGYPQEDISVLGTDTSSGREFFMEYSSKAPEGATWGAIICGSLLALLTVLVATGNIQDPGLGIGGLDPILAGFTGFGVGSLIGLIIGGLSGSALPEYEAELFPATKKHGGILLGVYTHPRRVREAKKVLDATGAKGIRDKDVRTEAIPYPTVSREYSTVGAPERPLE